MLTRWYHFDNRTNAYPIQPWYIALCDSFLMAGMEHNDLLNCDRLCRSFGVLLWNKRWSIKPIFTNYFHQQNLPFSLKAPLLMTLSKSCNVICSRVLPYFLHSSRYRSVMRFAPVFDRNMNIARLWQLWKWDKMKI